MKLHFYKLTGIGNDYVYLDFINKPKNINFQNLAKQISNRNFSVGADGLVVLLASKYADLKMRIFNCDGSEAEICGNALRCIAKLMYDKYKKEKLSVETKTKIVKTKIVTSIKSNSVVSVEMGKVSYIEKTKTFINSKSYTLHLLDVGNPHCVVFVENFSFDIENIGKTISTLKIFENGTNVEFVQILSNNILRVKVYERGSGITLACGSGACASAFCYAENFDITESKISVVLDGGELKIDISNKDNIVMTGPATYIFEGHIEHTN